MTNSDSCRRRTEKIYTENAKWQIRETGRFPCFPRSEESSHNLARISREREKPQLLRGLSTYHLLRGRELEPFVEHASSWSSSSATVGCDERETRGKFRLTQMSVGACERAQQVFAFFNAAGRADDYQRISVDFNRSTPRLPRFNGTKRLMVLLELPVRSIFTET